MTFQRARRDDQKVKRRQNILTIARELCVEQGAMGWSLNALGRRADITKSNLYRYFPSREAILMTLMHQDMQAFVDCFARDVEGRVLDIASLCQAMADQYAQRPFLCDLLSVAAPVLEQNIAPEPIAEIKRENLHQAGQIAEAIARSVSEMDVAQAERFAFASGVIVTGLWPMARPDAPMQKLARREGLEPLKLDFRSQLQEMLQAQAMGIVAT